MRKVLGFFFFFFGHWTKVVDKGGWVFFGSLNGDGGVDGWSKVVVGY